MYDEGDTDKTLFHRGNTYFEKGDLDNAIADYTAALTINPNLAEALHNRGFAYANKRDPDKAIADYTAALTIHPNYADALTDRGVAYAMKGDLDSAGADWEAALTIHPNDDKALYNRGNVYAKKGDWDNAIADYTAALTINPHFAGALYNRGNAYYNKGNLDSAIADYTAALRIHPNHYNAFTNRGIAYADKGDLNSAIADYTAALRINRHFAGAFNNRGLAYAHKGDLNSAIADYTAALRIHPNHYGALTNRGIAYADKDDWDNAIADYTATLRIHPNSENTLYNRGNAYYNKGDLDSAIADYTAALTINPNDTNAKNNLETARRKRGDEPVAPKRPELEGFMHIQGGTFMMGSPDTEAERFDDESPQHPVTVSEFLMGKYEVTQKEWIEIMGSNPSYFKGDNLPVENVGWYDAAKYCNARSQKEGLTPAYTIDTTQIDPNNKSEYDDKKWQVSLNQNANGYRLPTEAEWEYACRAGTTTPFNTGNNITTDQANYDGRYPYNNNPEGTFRDKTTVVGSFAPNAWGLCDMHGNVWEWCWDWYGGYSDENQSDPLGAGSGASHVLRGGSWGADAQFVRSSNRGVIDPDNPYGNYGFGLRVVRPLNSIGGRICA
jgi:formylglycine-generating enzyme required for sulfatase activity/Tfp pilus assembly protein PilF